MNVVCEPKDNRTLCIFTHGCLSSFSFVILQLFHFHFHLIGSGRRKCSVATIINFFPTSQEILLTVRDDVCIYEILLESHLTYITTKLSEYVANGLNRKDNSYVVLLTENEIYCAYYIKVNNKWLIWNEINLAIFLYDSFEAQD